MPTRSEWEAALEEAKLQGEAKIEKDAAARAKAKRNRKLKFRKALLYFLNKLVDFFATIAAALTADFLTRLFTGTGLFDVIERLFRR